MRGFEVARGFENRDINMPKRATVGSAGYDICVSIPDNGSIVIVPNGIAIFDTGVKAFMEDDEVLMIYPRSSIGIKRHLMLSNSTGIIDASYYGNETNDGHIMVALTNYGNEPQVIRDGDRVCQGVFVKYLTTVDDDVKAGRHGGIGSTGV